VRAANDICSCTIVPDSSRTAEENVELLLRALRLVQLGMEVQVADNDGLLQESNALREELKVSSRSGMRDVGGRAMGARQALAAGHRLLCSTGSSCRSKPSLQIQTPPPITIHHRNQSLEETNRSLEAEVGELRQQQDAAAEAGDIRELQRELRELRRAFDDERRANDDLTRDADRDGQSIEDLKTRCGFCGRRGGGGWWLGGQLCRDQFCRARHAASNQQMCIDATQAPHPPPTWPPSTASSAPQPSSS